jgi:hypothetical protein
MKQITILSAILLVAAAAFASYAQETPDHYCLNDCALKGGKPGYCNTLCTTRDESGNLTKDTGCIASCLKEGKSSYTCYSSCQERGGDDDRMAPRSPSTRGNNQ